MKSGRKFHPDRAGRSAITYLLIRFLFLQPLCRPVCAKSTRLPLCINARATAFVRVDTDNASAVAIALVLPL
ncbi:hypothetical protein KCP74_12435 [Salmonella enterica subsp. enterica]|nr:hypothetical protein KCP74_12435 [Salmonella enterica subsp. enterica]